MDTHIQHLHALEYAMGIVLASLARTFQLSDERRPHEIDDLAPQVFLMMRHWEALAILGRVIAVLNRRPRAG